MQRERLIASRRYQRLYLFGTPQMISTISGLVYRAVLTALDHRKVLLRSPKRRWDDQFRNQHCIAIYLELNDIGWYRRFERRAREYRTSA